MTDPEAAAAAFSLRPAAPGDAAAIRGLVRELADYERLSHLCVATEDDIARALFGPRRYAEVILAVQNVEVIGFALFFHKYSTFLAKPGIYLEDVFVLPEHRGAGVGKALLKRVAQIARERDCGRLEWSVLDWNEPAIEFYKRLGATVMPDWRICRMTGDEIAKLAET